MSFKHLLFIFSLLSSTVVHAMVATEEKSPNGIAYTLIKLPDAEQISLQLAWENDWITQQDKNQTVPYIGTQLILAGGAENYSPGEVVETFADLESEGFLNPGLGHIYGVLNVKKEHLDETLAIANAHLHKPTLDNSWLNRIRQQIKSNVSEYNSQQASKTTNTLLWALMGDSPVRESLSLDTPDQFDQVTRDEIIQWHQQTITNAPEAIVVAGNIDKSLAGNAIDKLLAGLPKASINSSNQPESFNYTPKRILLHLPEANTSQLFFYGRIPPTRLGKEFEDIIITQALGGGEQSELFNAVRTQLRASYNYGAAIANFTREDRLFFMGGEVETEKVAKAEKIILQTYENFLSQGPAGELSEYKATQEHPFKHLYKNASAVTGSAIQSKLDGYNNQRVLTLLDELQAVSTESIKDRLENAFPKANEFIIIVTSPDTKALGDACIITTPKQAKEC